MSDGPERVVRNGGALLVACLEALGARMAFGVPGESYLPVLDAMYDTRGRFDFVLCRQEGGAAFMADAYGKLTGTPGICMVTRGPGVTNASIGIHSAMQASTPALYFVGQVGTDMLGREAFQEINYRAVFGTVAKWATEIEHVDRIPEIVSRAWSVALSGRPGPVVIALPEDVLSAETATRPLSRVPAIAEPAPAATPLAETRRALAEASRPLIIMGGAGWTAEGKAAIQRFAEASQIPVLCAFRYLDLFDNNSPVFSGDAGVGMTAGVKKLITDADLVLALNIRFGEMTTGAYTLFDVPEARQRIVHAHASADEIGKIYSPEIALHAGPNTTSVALADAPIAGDWASWCREARAQYVDGLEAPEQPSPVDMGVVMKTLRERLADDAILTNGAGNFAVWPSKFFVYGPKHRLLGPQSGAMGYGLPAAVAAKVVYPDRQVVCVAGDGDFQMNCQELGTAMQVGRGPVILVVNNGTYGTIRMHQERTYPERVSGTELQNPDFSALAASYGFHGERVETTADFPAALERALASPTGAVLDLNVSAEALSPRQSLSQMRAAALAAKG